jgi:hypothetical protein
MASRVAVVLRVRSWHIHLALLAARSERGKQAQDAVLNTRSDPSIPLRKPLYERSRSHGHKPTSSETILLIN